jgi:hypothetical protein
MKTYQSSIKQNTQQRERKRVQNGKTQVLANEESSKEGRFKKSRTNQILV